ncbi:MAG: SpoIIE family protein phosphatase [Gemmatimonadales bacterium]
MTACVEWGVATRTLTGQDQSGDRHVVCPYPGGALLAVVDGLGHGDEAAAAARVACTILGARPRASAIALIRECHEALRGTRGAVMSLATFNATDDTMTWLGVGNVEAVLIRADPNATSPREAMLLRGGVVGYELPKLRAGVLMLDRGDTLVLATDGIRGGFAERVSVTAPPKPHADELLDQLAKDSDDALVLVARYLGGGG